MSRPIRLNAYQEVQIRNSLHDNAMLDLVRDMVDRLNEVGDRLEQFAESRVTPRGGGEDARD